MHFVVQELRPLEQVATYVTQLTNEQLASSGIVNRISTNLLPISVPKVNLTLQEHNVEEQRLTSSLAHTYGYGGNAGQNSVAQILTYSAPLDGNPVIWDMCVKFGIVNFDGKHFYLHGSKLHYAELTTNMERDVDAITQRARDRFNGLNREFETIRIAVEEYREKTLNPAIINQLRAERLKRDQKTSVQSKMRM